MVFYFLVYRPTIERSLRIGEIITHNGKLSSFHNNDNDSDNSHVVDTVDELWSTKAYGIKRIKFRGSFRRTSTLSYCRNDKNHNLIRDETLGETLVRMQSGETLRQTMEREHIARMRRFSDDGGATGVPCGNMTFVNLSHQRQLRREFVATRNLTTVGGTRQTTMTTTTTTHDNRRRNTSRRPATSNVQRRRQQSVQNHHEQTVVEPDFGSDSDDEEDDNYGRRGISFMSSISEEEQTSSPTSESAAETTEETTAQRSRRERNTSVSFEEPKFGPLSQQQKGDQQKEKRCMRVRTLEESLQTIQPAGSSEQQVEESERETNTPSSQQQQQSSGSTTASESRSSTSGTFRTLKFGNVQVREYATCLGDNPSCSNGPPLSVDWKYRAVQPIMSVNEYERQRPSSEHRATATEQNLKLDCQTRKQLLLKLGYSEYDIRKADMKKRQDQMNREETLIRMQYSAYFYGDSHHKNLSWRCLGRSSSSSSMSSQQRGSCSRVVVGGLMLH